jgi:hypothetical protein
MIISQETYNKFFSITKFDISRLVIDIQDFFENDFDNLVKFYSGDVKNLNILSIKKLSSLLIELSKLNSIFLTYNKRLSTIDFWELIVLVEDLKSKLLFSKNLSKYLRSSITSGITRRGYKFNYLMSPEETLESISKDVLNSDDFDNDWIEIAIDNDLKEVDWDIDGGKNISLVDNSFQSNLVTSMIDNSIGDKIYGLDIKKNIEFENDDLLVLNHKDTVLQTVSILASLSKGDIPEFPSIGINSNIWKGSNASQMNFPLLSRELNSNFKTDDLFINFKILSIQYNNGDIEIQYEVNTKRNFVIINNVTI